MGPGRIPSVYQGDPYLLTLLPHRIEWMLGAALHLVAGGLFWWFGHTDFALLFSGVGAAALLVTVVKCFRFAMVSDLSQMGQIPGWSASTSRLLARLTIAWLHLAQPVARAMGRLRGTLAGLPQASPQSATPPRPLAFAEIKRAVPLLLGRTVERHYWSERWSEPGAWLSRILTQLRTARVGRAVEVDDGWQELRDLSVEIGRSSWLDIRSLEEDHGSGRRFGRIELRLRLTRFGRLVIALMVAAFAGGAALGTVTLGSIPWWSVMAGLLGVAAIAGRWVWQVTRLFAATERAIDEGSLESGFESIEVLEQRSVQAADADL